MRYLYRLSLEHMLASLFNALTAWRIEAVQLYGGILATANKIIFRLFFKWRDRRDSPHVPSRQAGPEATGSRERRR